MAGTGRVQTGLKTKFLRKGTTTFEEIASVASITPPQLGRDVSEYEELDPPTDIKGKVFGLVDAGEVSVKLNFREDDAGQLALEQDFWEAVEGEYAIKFPSGKGHTIKGVVTGWAPQEITQGDPMQVDVTITVTDKPVYGDVAEGV